MRLLLLLLSLALTFPLAACGPEDDDPFGRGDSGDDDDDATEDVGPEDIAGWIEFQRRSNVSSENTVEVFAFSAFFPPVPVDFGAPVPQEMDACASGTSQPSLFDLPQNQYDVGNTVLHLAEDEEAVIEDLDPELNRFVVEIDTESWVPEQEYGVSLVGGADADAATFDGILGTPEVLALTDDIVEVADGLLIRWFGQNSNGHIEARFIGAPLEVEGEDEGAIRWVACRLNDDGQHTLAFSEFDVFDGDQTLVELVRKRSTDLEYAPDRIARVVGSSVVHTPWQFPDVPGDDDDSADDDDDDSAD